MPSEFLSLHDFPNYQILIACFSFARVIINLDFSLMCILVFSGEGICPTDGVQGLSQHTLLLAVYAIYIIGLLCSATAIFSFFFQADFFSGRNIAHLVRQRLCTHLKSLLNTHKSSINTQHNCSP